MGVLSEIKPEHIAEMTYLDEWDTSIDKLGAQGGLFVVLKPGIGYEPGKSRRDVTANRSRPIPPQPRRRHAARLSAPRSLACMTAKPAIRSKAPG